MDNSNVTPLHPKETNQKEEKSLVSSLSPREIVSELDRFVVGQNKAKKAVAVALRNRWRRQALKGEMKNEVLPKNILMIGPTGVGKTSFFISPFKACRLHLFLRATATAFLALFWPTTNLSNSETISLGDNELTKFSLSLEFLSFGTRGVTLDFSIIFFQP